MKKFLLRHIIFLLACFNFSSGASAQTFTDSYKTIWGETYKLTFGVSYIKYSGFLIVEINSCGMSFKKEPKMKIISFNNEYLELDGFKTDDTKNNYGVIVGNIVYPVTKNSTMAIFPINNNFIDLIKNGISFLTLTMEPINFELSYKKDKIGKKIYKLYQKEQKKYASIIKSNE